MLFQRGEIAREGPHKVFSGVSALPRQWIIFLTSLTTLDPLSLLHLSYLPAVPWTLQAWLFLQGHGFSWNALSPRKCSVSIIFSVSLQGHSLI